MSRGASTISIENVYKAVGVGDEKIKKIKFMPPLMLMTRANLQTIVMIDKKNEKNFFFKKIAQDKKRRFNVLK